jgi:hypothetical protein
VSICDVTVCNRSAKRASRRSISAAAACQSTERRSQRRSGGAKSLITKNTLTASSDARIPGVSTHARSATQHASNHAIVTAVAIPAARSSAFRRRSRT